MPLGSIRETRSHETRPASSQLAELLRGLTSGLTGTAVEPVDWCARPDLHFKDAAVQMTVEEREREREREREML